MDMIATVNRRRNPVDSAYPGCDTRICEPLHLWSVHRESPGDRKKAKKHPKREVVDRDSDEDEDSEDDWEEVEGKVSLLFSKLLESVCYLEPVTCCDLVIFVWNKDKKYSCNRDFFQMTKFLGLAVKLVFFSSSGFDRGTKQRKCWRKRCTVLTLHSLSEAGFFTGSIL